VSNPTAQATPHYTDTSTETAGKGSSLEPGEENGVQLEMASGKRPFSCRGERETLGTRLDASPTQGNGKEEAHWLPAGGRCVMRSGGWRERSMIVIPRAKQPQGVRD
jgi:hypothetical protein